MEAMTTEPKRVKRNLILSSPVVVQLERQATAERRTKSAVVERALVEYFDRAKLGDRALAS